MNQGGFLRRIVSALDQAGIPYMVVGSLASTLHGVPRATRDVDLVISPTTASLDALLGQLPPDRYYVDGDAAREALAQRGQFNVIDLSTGWKADLVIRKHRPFSEQEMNRRIFATVLGVEVSVATPEDTILAKLEWSAMGESDRQLADAAGILSLGEDRLDLAYLERWVRELEVESVWERARKLAVS